MNAADPQGALQRALELSRKLAEVAESGEIASVAGIDAQRRRLLDSLRPIISRLNAAERLVLQQITDLNDRAIGFLEHRRRRTERLMDTAAAGRRAVVAYSSTRSRP